MLTIEVSDLSNLSRVQREALSAFILDRADVLTINRPIAEDSVFEKAFASIEHAKATRKLQEHIDAVEAESTPEQAFGSPQTLENGGLTQDDAHNIVYGKGEFTPAAPALQPAVTPSVDRSGLPWDERIHSSSKNFTADGSWRKKRGVDDALVAQVEGQLKQVMSLPAPAAPAAAAVPPPPPPAGPALVPTPANMDDRQAYINLVGSVSKALQTAKLTQEELQAVLTKHGLPPQADGKSSLSLLVNRFDLIPQVAMDIEAMIVVR